jgi:hypothetical protein
MSVKRGDDGVKLAKPRRIERGVEYMEPRVTRVIWVGRVIRVNGAINVTRFGLLGLI